MCRMIWSEADEGKEVSANLLVWAAGTPDTKKKGRELGWARWMVSLERVAGWGDFRRWRGARKMCRGALGDCQKWQMSGGSPLSLKCWAFAVSVSDAMVDAEGIAQS